MIKTKIKAIYPHHQITDYEKDIFVIDYTEQTKKAIVKRGVEIHTISPIDIEMFSLYNPNYLQLGTVIYNNQSFIDIFGHTQSQCECVIFPYDANEYSWILFIELKYCNDKKKRKRLNEAKNQLFATYEHFKSNNITTEKQWKYLVVSLPKLNCVPFESFISSPGEKLAWRKDKIIFKGINEVYVNNSEKLTFL